MGLLKKFSYIIIILSLLAAFFPLSSRAASSDIDIDYTHRAQTIFDLEDYIKRRQDTYLNFINSKNSQVISNIISRFQNGEFFYIILERDTSKNDYYNFEIRFYTMPRYFVPGSTYDSNFLFHTNIAYPNGSFAIDENLINIGNYYEIQVDRPNKLEIQYTYSEQDNLNYFENVQNNSTYMPACLVGYVSDFFLRLMGGSSGSSSNDYSNILYTISSDLSTLLYNSNTIMGDIANVKTYTNYINNKLTTTNTYLTNIQGAITNGSSTITNTIVSTHNLDNSNDNKNTNEIIDAINNNTNAISDIQVTNDNSGLINAINNGFSNLNSNNNNNKNEIVSAINSASEDITEGNANIISSVISNDNSNKNQIVNAINNASEEIVDGGDNNTSSIISNSNSNTNDIVEAIEGITITGGSGGITNSEYSQGVTAINDNNDYNTNRILDNQITEEDADIFSNIDVPEFEDPLPNLSNTLNNFFNNITNSNIQSKSFNLPFKNMHLNFTLDYNTLYNNFFSKNTTFYNLYKALWWGLVGFYVYKKLRIFYNKCIAGEWDEVVTAFDDSDEVIGRSVK